MTSTFHGTHLKTGNVAAEEQDLPDDIAAELAAMDGKAANTSKKKKVA